MVRFSLKLLGSFEVRPASGSTALAPGKKIQALLATLGVRPGQSHSRDRLASLLWGDVGQEQARHSVRQAIFSIRRMLAEDVLITLGETVALNLEAVTVDVAEFEELSARATAEALDHAARLYRGDLLEGFRLRQPAYEAWLAVERDRLRREAIAVLDRLTQIRMNAGRLDAAIESANRLVTLEPMREATHRTLMRLYLQTGRRAAAVRQYQACQRLLADDLGVEPDAETRALYSKILETRGLAAAEPNGRPTRAALLIVEDEPVTRAVLEGFLGMAGYDITAVSDGADALFQLSGRHFDLILSDIGMPTLDGLALAEVIARKGLQTPVIFITGQPGEELEIKGLELGAVDFIRKPIQKDVLLLRVRKALRAG
jgi:DNA-binding SARP family transcriptional activator